jgi:hypothetical protein
MKSNVFVISTVRNVARTIKHEYTNLSKALSMFNSVTWVVVESDSSDETLLKLQELKKIRNFHFITLGNLASNGLMRTERIAQSRNAGLATLFGEFKVNSDDFIVLADLDGRNRLLNERSVFSCWQMDTRWDMCSANQYRYYYDIWALRHAYWCPEDCFLEYNALLASGFSEDIAYELAVRNKMIKIPENSAPISVISSYGGFAIYRSNLLRGALYRGKDDFGNEECDHVNVNVQLHSAGFKLYINPRLINSRSEGTTRKAINSLQRRVFSFKNK